MVLTLVADTIMQIDITQSNRKTAVRRVVQNNTEDEHQDGKPAKKTEKEKSELSEEQECVSEVKKKHKTDHIRFACFTYVIYLQKK